MFKTDRIGDKARDVTTQFNITINDILEMSCPEQTLPFITALRMEAQETFPPLSTASNVGAHVTQDMKRTDFIIDRLLAALDVAIAQDFDVDDIANCLNDYTENAVQKRLN